MSSKLRLYRILLEQANFGMMGFVLVIAFLYSSVGFGGASGYLAVMAWLEIPINIAVSTALILNLIVAGIAFISYFKSGYFVPKLLWPFVMGSIPAAFLGSTVQLGQFTYLIILHVILFLIAIRMLTYKEVGSDDQEVNPPLIWITFVTGAGLGFLAGMIGIGGGIFLSPIIIISKWGNPKHAAATAAGFIFLNSLSGLIGRVLVNKFEFGSFGLLLIPVGVIGSLLGSHLGVNFFSGKILKKLLGIILLISVIRFAFDWLIT